MQIRTHEGSIAKETLDGMIEQVRARYLVETSLADIRKEVIDDYFDCDISVVTPQDVVEIIDASGLLKTSSTIKRSMNNR